MFYEVEGAWVTRASVFCAVQQICEREVPAWSRRGHGNDHGMVREGEVLAEEHVTALSRKEQKKIGREKLGLEVLSQFFRDGPSHRAQNMFCRRRRLPTTKKQVNRY